jgi:positive regulator of sigma E activity
MASLGSNWTKASNPATGSDEEGTAAGIYGVIVSSAVMASSHANGTVVVAASVVITLVVYWAAERYARLVAERIHDGRRPTWREVRRQLTRGWEFVTASFLPLVVMIVARLLAAGVSGSVLAGLVCSTVLLCVAGWEMGRHGQLRRGERLVYAGVAGLFGVGMIAMKALLH